MISHRLIGGVLAIAAGAWLGCLAAPSPEGSNDGGVGESGTGSSGGAVVRGDGGMAGSESSAGSTGNGGSTGGGSTSGASVTSSTGGASSTSGMSGTGSTSGAASSTGGAGGTSGTSGGCSQTCPAFGGRTIYVDATAGVDGPCCGRQAAAGCGGPCATLGKALQALPGAGWTIQLTGDPSGDANPSEGYPIHLGKGVTLASSGKICFPGVQGQNVFDVDQDATTVTLTAGGGSFIIGESCAGASALATDGILVQQAADGSSPTAVLQGLRIAGVQVGVDVEAASAQGSGVWIQSVSTGVYCGSPGQSSTAPSAFTVPDGQSVAVSGALNSDLVAWTNCTLKGTFQLGAPAPCPATKVDDTGITAQGNASVDVGGSISCMNSYGIQLSKDSMVPGAPTVSFHGGRISHAGCAGLLAAQGTISLSGVQVDHNHYGAELAPGGKLVLSSASAGAANSFSCNTKAEPGVCCQAGGFCPPGADVWNASGGRLSATGDLWDDPAVTQCACEAADPATGEPSGCSCSGGAQLHDGIAVLDLPASGETDTSGAGIAAGACP